MSDVEFNIENKVIIVAIICFFTAISIARVISFLESKNKDEVIIKCIEAGGEVLVCKDMSNNGKGR